MRMASSTGLILGGAVVAILLGLFVIFLSK